MENSVIGPPTIRERKVHLAKDVLNRAKYDTIIQSFEIPLCTFSAFRYSEIRHVCLI